MNEFMKLDFEKQGSRPDATDIFSTAVTLSEISSIDGSHWKLCLHPFEYRRNLNPNLDTLIKDCSTNPFFNTAFIAASRDRMIRQQVFQLIAWEYIGDAPVPRFNVPLSNVQKTWFIPEHYKTLTHPFAPFGDPLIDQSSQDETLLRLADLFRVAFENGMKPLVVDYLSSNSSFHSLMKISNERFGTAVIAQGKRAAIDLVSLHCDAPLISKKRNRELNRLHKKLEQEGEVTFEHVNDPFEVILKFEEFLLMETKGWKGRAASSIHVIKKHAAFARQAVNDLARQSLCEIFTMRFNNRPIASIILFESGGHYFPWKISYDHLFSKYSPGSQLMNKLTAEITARDGFKSADSLAMFGQSWMSHLWPDEISLSSMILAEDTAIATHLGHRIAQKDNLKSSIKKHLFRK